MLLSHGLGIYALVIGTALGLIAQMLVQLPSFLSIGKYRPMIDLHHPGLTKIWLLLGPIIVGSAAGQLALFFDRFFASTLVAGVHRRDELRGQTRQLPAADFRRRDRDGDLSVVGGAVRARQPARHRAQRRDRLAFGQLHHDSGGVRAHRARASDGPGALRTRFFQASATDLTAGLLPYAAVGLIALGANVVLTRCCFACQEMVWPVTISVLTVVLNVLLSLVWLPALGARGLLLANSTSQSLQAVAAADRDGAARFRYRLGSARLLDGQIVVCSLAMLAALHWIGALGVTPEASLRRAPGSFSVKSPLAERSSSRSRACSTWPSSISPGTRSWRNSNVIWSARRRTAKPRSPESLR